MRIEVLGPIRVVDDDGRDVTPGGVMQRRLLARLAASAPAPVSTGALADLLWPAGAPSANAFPAQVSKLRRVIGAPAIVATGSGYRLDLAEVRLDADELLRALERGAAETGAVDRLASLIAEPRGRALDELVDDDEVARAVAVRWEAAARAARRELARARLALGDDTTAERDVERWLTHDLVDEELWELLMRSQYSQGRQADALRTFQRARAALADVLGVEPGPRLRDVERAVLEQDPDLEARRAVTSTETANPAGADPPSSSSPRGPGGRPRGSAVPRRLTSFVGRHDVLRALGADLYAARLVTVLGPGGAGKTSTAARLADDLEADGAEVVFVALTRAEDADAVMGVVARSVGADDGSRRAGLSDLERLIDAIYGRPMVLLLDNCEHVIDGAAALAHELLEACPDLRVLATSREALRVPGEIVRALPPLELSEAIELFVERAAALDPSLPERLDDDAARQQLAHLCAAVDRLPLAIELAAARMRTMSLDELGARLDDRLGVLTAGARTSEPRQQTIRAVIDWSHDLLDDDERTVFRRFGVFDGGADLAAVRAVCGARGPTDVDDVLARLVDKSLVVVERHPELPTRYRMLELVTEYARSTLLASGEVEAVSDGHARHVADSLVDTMRRLTGPEQRTELARLALERRNLRDALSVALARGDADLALRIAAPLGWYFYMVGEIEEGRSFLADALGCPGLADPAARALALGLHAWLVVQGPNFDEAVAASAQAADALSGVDDPWVEAIVLSIRAMVMFFFGDLDGSLRVHAEAGDAAERSGDRWARALVDIVEGEVRQGSGDVATAEQAFLRAADELERLGDRFAYSLVLGEAAEVAELRGEYDDAIDQLRRAIGESGDWGFSTSVSALEARLANLMILSGDLDGAERVHRRLLDAASESGEMFLRGLSMVGLSNIARRRGDAEAARAAAREGWELPRTRSVPVMRQNVLVALGYSADLDGAHEEALEHQLAGLASVIDYPQPRTLAYSLEGVAGALAISPHPDDHVLASRLLGHADAVRRASGGPMPAAERFDVARAEERLERALGRDALAAALADGAAADYDELAVELRRRGLAGGDGV